MNWYAATLIGRLEKYDVDRSSHVALKSSCAWTADKLTEAMAPFAEKDGMADLRINDFRPIEPLSKAELRKTYEQVIDVDCVLGI